MNKFVIWSTLCLPLSVFSGLAMADDSKSGAGTSGQSGTSGSTTSSGSMSTDSGMTSSDTSKEMETTKTKETSKTSKSCTDESGVTYRKGEKGFKSCMQTMEKKKESEQMGGQSGSSSKQD